MASVKSLVTGSVPGRALKRRIFSALTWMHVRIESVSTQQTPESLAEGIRGEPGLVAGVLEIKNCLFVLGMILDATEMNTFDRQFFPPQRRDCHNSRSFRHHRRPRCLRIEFPRELRNP